MAKQPTIKDFVSSMSRAGGYARTSRYAVHITPPGNLDRLIQRSNSEPLGYDTEVNLKAHKKLLRTKAIMNQVGKQVNLHCNSIKMPGHDLKTQDVQHGSAPGRQMVQSHDYKGEITASFYLDSHLRERHFFEQWQSLAVNKSTHKANYYDDYIGSMEIFQLDGNDEITYGMKLTEVYPETIGGIEYSYANSALALQTVNFQYRQWFNLTEESIAGYRNSDQYTLMLKPSGPAGQ